MSYMLVVVSYDIAEDKRRNKVYNTLKDYGVWVQYSVFECNLNQDQLKELQQRLANIINPRKDSVRYYFLCKGCLDKCQVQGKNRF